MYYKVGWFHTYNVVSSISSPVVGILDEKYILRHCGSSTVRLLYYLVGQLSCHLNGWVFMMERSNPPIGGPTSHVKFIHYKYPYISWMIQGSSLLYTQALGSSSLSSGFIVTRFPGWTPKNAKDGGVEPRDAKISRTMGFSFTKEVPCVVFRVTYYSMSKLDPWSPKSVVPWSSVFFRGSRIVPVNRLIILLHPDDNMVFLLPYTNCEPTRWTHDEPRRNRDKTTIYLFTSLESVSFCTTGSRI